MQDLALKIDREFTALLQKIVAIVDGEESPSNKTVDRLKNYVNSLTLTSLLMRKDGEVRQKFMTQLQESDNMAASLRELLTVSNVDEITEAHRDAVTEVMAEFFEAVKIDLTPDQIKAINLLMKAEGETFIQSGAL